MRLNFKLHRRIARLSSNVPLHRIYTMLLDSMEEALGRAEMDAFDGAAHLADHRDLVTAINRGEGPELESAIVRQSPSYSASRR